MTSTPRPLLEGSRRHLQDRGCTHWAVSVLAASDGAVQLYQRAGVRPWLLELAAPLDDGPGRQLCDDADARLDP